ncbi:MAG: NADH-quinone oxidoreductase subunit J [Candidatus Omnitrophica bacterium]|nr:NADH-quinone oxidoreductase subunit J [Candidatus Omnitrophota bacterium]
MNYLEVILFYLFSLTAIASALMVVTNRRPTYGVLALTITMLALSALFVLLEAYFVAAIQILIYAGAILVLFLFVIMLLGIGDEPNRETVLSHKRSSQSNLSKMMNMFFLLVLLSELMIVILAMQDLPSPQRDLSGTVEAIGEALFGPYLLPFELVSGILLIGIFGVVNLAQLELKKRQ